MENNPKMPNFEITKLNDYVTAIIGDRQIEDVTEFTITSSSKDGTEIILKIKPKTFTLNIIG